MFEIPLGRDRFEMGATLAQFTLFLTESKHANFLTHKASSKRGAANRSTCRGDPGVWNGGAMPMAWAKLCAARVSTI